MTSSAFQSMRKGYEHPDLMKHIIETGYEISDDFHYVENAYKKMSPDAVMVYIPELHIFGAKDDWRRKFFNIKGYDWKNLHCINNFCCSVSGCSELCDDECPCLVGGHECFHDTCGCRVCSMMVIVPKFSKVSRLFDYADEQISPSNDIARLFRIANVMNSLPDGAPDDNKRVIETIKELRDAHKSRKREVKSLREKISGSGIDAFRVWFIDDREKTYPKSGRYLIRIGCNLRDCDVNLYYATIIHQQEIHIDEYEVKRIIRDVITEKQPHLTASIAHSFSLKKYAFSGSLDKFKELIKGICTLLIQFI